MGETLLQNDGDAWEARLDALAAWHTANCAVLASLRHLRHACAWAFVGASAAGTVWACGGPRWLVLVHAVCAAIGIAAVTQAARLYVRDRRAVEQADAAYDVVVASTRGRA